MATETPAELFDLVGHPGRLSIVEELIAAKRGDDDSRSFTTLRDRSAIDDTGRFNYHLGELVGTVVEKTDEGYRLSPYGHRITAPLMGGLYDPDRVTDSIETDGSCYDCGADLRIEPTTTVLRLVCEQGHVNNHGLLGYPGVTEDRTVEEASRALGLVNRQGTELAVAGTCPACHGAVDGEIVPLSAAGLALDGPEEWFVFEAPCETCGNQFTTTVGACVATHPAVVSFLYEHDTDVRNCLPWSLAFAAPGAERVEAREPLRLGIEIARGEESLDVVVEKTAEVSSVERIERR
jgi:hypothetical protein